MEDQTGSKCEPVSTGAVLFFLLGIIKVKVFTSFFCAMSWCLGNVMVDWLYWCCIELFHASLLDCVCGGITLNSRRLAVSTVQGGSLFSAIGQGHFKHRDIQSWKRDHGSWGQGVGVVTLNCFTFTVLCIQYYLLNVVFAHSCVWPDVSVVSIISLLSPRSSCEHRSDVDQMLVLCPLSVCCQLSHHVDTEVMLTRR